MIDRLEARLGAAAVQRETGVPPAIETSSSAAAEASGDAAELAAAQFPSAEVAPPPAWPDEAAESAFRSEAKERGEPMVAAHLASEVTQEVDAGPLPSLEELVRRIPPHVRETLDDLFRARFVTVRRVPERALKR